MLHVKREPIITLTKKDFKVVTFRSGGAGGQNQNKRDTGVRITHIETDFSSECREERSQLQNKKKAFRKLVNNKQFRNWLAMKTLAKGDIEKKLDEAMSDDNLMVERYDKQAKAWVKVEECI